MADGAGKHITMLDGGVGHLIKQWGVVLPDLPYDQQFLAGCLALKAAPETVIRAHAAYIDCGCNVITTNNFVATQFSLDKVSKGSEHTQYCQQAGELARRAVAQFGSQCKVLVAGSLPPLQESYQTTGLPVAADMQAQYMEIARALDPYVDLFLAETLSMAAEAQAAIAAAAAIAPGKPLWVSFTLEDSTAACLRDGQHLSAALQQLQGCANLAAVLVNCCAPAAVTAALPVLKSSAPPGVKVGCYANGFQTTTTQWLTGRADGLPASVSGDYGPDGTITPEAYLRHAQEWAAAGAHIIGGCCGIGPQHMQLLASSLKAAE